MITIKEVRKKDKKAVDKFAESEWKKFNQERGYQFNEKKYLIAAYENKKIMGFASFKINGGASYLSQLLISKKARRKGLGHLLITKFEEISKKKRCHIAYLETSERHKEALKFYKKHGYKIVATLKNNKFHFTWYFLEKKLK